MHLNYIGWMALSVLFMFSINILALPCSLSCSCKTAYTGHVRVDYSLNQGGDWTNLGFYEVWKYTSGDFFHIELEIPDEARSTQIRFRFTQNVFESARDNWALDNVKVSRIYVLDHIYIYFVCFPL
mgnify:CR=1 FL=1